MRDLLIIIAGYDPSEDATDPVGFWTDLAGVLVGGQLVALAYVVAALYDLGRW